MSQVQSFVVTARNIEAEAIERSAEVPVLLEFWAEWCEPCKTLTPILEKVVADYGGAFVLGKIDVEQEHQLAQVFQVQSVPYAVLMVGRRPVDAFTGAQTEAALGAFLSRNGVSPAATGADATPPEPDATAEQLIAAHRRAAAGDAEGAREALAALPEDHELLADSKHLVTGLDFLEAELPAAGPEAATCLRAARERLLAGDLEAALKGILDSAAADRGYGHGLASKAMLLCQALHGAEHDLVETYRRRLATLLY
ncbi:MAG: tetratricopeptide repeat protein [Planctomycetota bacterium]|jgi:putative thioredoxin